MRTKGRTGVTEVNESGVEDSGSGASPPEVGRLVTAPGAEPRRKRPMCWAGSVRETASLRAAAQLKPEE